MADQVEGMERNDVNDGIEGFELKMDSTQSVVDGSDTLPVMYYPGFLGKKELEFGLNMDILGRFPPKKLPKKTYKTVYHYHGKCDIDYRNIWLELKTHKLICKHIDNDYTILTDINGKYILKMRRIIWPFALKHYNINTLFEYNLDDMNKYFRWIIILNHGGRFGIGLFHGNSLIKSKMIHRNVVRRKQGKRQYNYIKQTSKTDKNRSAGSDKRAYMERKLRDDIQNILFKWKNEFNGCNKIFIHAPNTINNAAIFGDANEQKYLYPMKKNGKLNHQLSEQRLNNNNGYFYLNKNDHRIERIPMTTYNVTLNEIIRVHYMLTTCWLTCM